MLIATIGVFGVMVMIPFAVDQSQKGIDSDLANVLGRNAVEKLQIHGVFRSMTINDDAGNPIDEVLGTVVFPSADNVDHCDTVKSEGGEESIAYYSLQSVGLPADIDSRSHAGLVHLDPIGVSHAPDPVTSFIVDRDQTEPQIVIPSVTLRNGDTLQPTRDLRSRFSSVEARTYCSTDDDLMFGEYRFDSESGYVKTSDLAPPQAIYDFAGGRPIKRQSEGSVSWSAILNPSKYQSIVKENAEDAPTPPSHFSAYILTWRRRAFDGDSFSIQITNEPGKYGLGANDRLPVLTQISLKDSIPEKSPISKGDWVMLINLLPLPDYETFSEPQLALSQLVDETRYRADEPGYDKQVLFAQVTRVNQNEPHSISIDGGAFEIFPEEVARSATYLVYLPDVINVYERSIPIEH